MVVVQVLIDVNGDVGVNHCLLYKICMFLCWSMRRFESDNVLFLSGASA
jgi:hypothetical protein